MDAADSRQLDVAVFIYDDVYSTSLCRV